MELTTAQILALARKKILEETDEIVDDATLYIYGSLTQDDIARRAYPESSILSASVNFVAGVGTFPTRFGTLYGDAYENAYSVYPEVSIADFARQNSGNAITVQNGQLKIYPARTVTLTVNYYPTYATLSASQEPTVDPYFRELIVYGILHRAFEDLQDHELSKYFREKYDAELKIKIDAQSQYEESNQRGGQMFNGIPIITDNSGGLSSNPNLI